MAINPMLRASTSIALILGINLFVSGQQAAISESTAYSPRNLSTKAKDLKQIAREIEESRRFALPNENNAISANGILEFSVIILDAQLNPVEDIKPSDIEVLVDNRPIEPISINRQTQPLKICLLIDSSDSTTIDEKALRSLGQKVIASLTASDELSIMRFSGDIETVLGFTRDHMAAGKALSKIGLGGGTDIYDTVATLLLKKLHNTDHDLAVVTITDGVDTGSRKWSYSTSLVTAERGNIPFYTIYLNKRDALLKSPMLAGVPTGLTPLLGTSKADYDVGAAYLSDLSILSGGHIAKSESLSAGRSQAFDAIFSGLRNRISIQLKVPTEGHSGDRHALLVRVKRPRLKVFARASYIQP